MDRKVRLRFAPSPTGYLHVGGARTALFCYLFAKNHKGDFILRIEDTDQKRSTQESVEQVLESLKWMGLNWDEGPEIEGDYGPYFQSKRLDIYNKAFDVLKKKGVVYPCFCTDEELSEKKAKAKALNLPNIYDRRCYHLEKKDVDKKIADGVPYTYRFKVEDKELILDDLVKGRIKFDTKKLFGDFIVRKQDGFPTYNFAVVVDDSSMEISHVLRGDDHLSNTPKQLLLYEALEKQIPIFGHISTILGSDREKLSKRHGATSILDFKQKGYLKEAFINFLALLGWSTGTEQEILTEKELIEQFSRTKFNKAPAVFDYTKLNYFNSYYIRNMDLDRAVRLFDIDAKDTFIDQDSYIYDDKVKLKLVIELARDYCVLLTDIKKYFLDFVSTRYEIEEECRHYIDSSKTKLIPFAIDFFSKKESSDLEEGEFGELIGLCKKELKIKGRDFFKPMRVALTGREEGYELDKFLKVLNRHSIIDRLQKSLNH